MANLSKLKRQRMLDFLSSLRDANKNNDEVLMAINELENDILGRKFGLVWEEHSESVQELIVDNIPVFSEVEEKELIFGDGKFNFLLEGDNLHSLILLNKTHHEKIDVICIDPPYNTGKEFIYDDDLVDVNDGYRHSKWVSFMNRRLSIAHDLLKKDGVIFISIDDNEQAQLKVLCDSIFGDTNCLGVLPTIMNLKGNQDEFGFAGTHEYTLVYAKDKDSCLLGQFPVEDEEIDNEWDLDEVGYYKKGANLKSTGVNAPRSKRPNLFFPIYIKELNGEHVWSLEDNGGEAVLPITNGEEMSWRWSKNKFLRQPHDVIITKNSSGYSLYKKQRPALGDLPTKKPKSTLYKPEYSSGNGTAQLKDIFRRKVFDNPKPIDLIMDFIRVGSTNKDAIILDFFAGSGTTGHATLALNKEDGGNRSFILCTNNENSICENITYERLKTISSGIRADGNEYREKYESNLKYYKTDFISKESKDIALSLNEHIDEMIQLEYGVKIDKEKYISILSDDDADDLERNWKSYPNICGIYISRHVLLTANQKSLFSTKETFVIPDYYFREELREVGEA